MPGSAEDKSRDLNMENINSNTITLKKSLRAHQLKMISTNLDQD